jgi:uncharacterized membrane protein
MDQGATSPLPQHVEETVRAIQKLHEDHHNSATLAERLAASVTGVIARPIFIGILTVLIGVWIGINLMFRDRGMMAWDQPPFPWLEEALTLIALYIAALILITQRRADMLATHREQMTLQLAFLSEQKAGKMIALIEELRRDSPHVADRRDTEAEAMSAPVDAHEVSKAMGTIGPDDGAGLAKSEKDAGAIIGPRTSSRI